MVGGGCFGGVVGREGGVVGRVGGVVGCVYAVDEFSGGCSARGFLDGAGRVVGVGATSQRQGVGGGSGVRGAVGRGASVQG